MIHSSTSFSKTPKSWMLIFGILLFSAANSFAQSDCKTTNNFFESLGGTSSDQSVKGSNGCKTMVMDDGFEVITLTLGSIPEESADFTIVNHDAEPGEGEVAVKYFYYSGNEEETLEFGGTGTVHVCNNGGKITVTWSGVVFKGTANGKLNYKTKCEMTCGG